MLTVYTNQHQLRDPKTELYGGQLVTLFECPARMDYVLQQVQQVNLGPIVEPDDFGMEPVLHVHDRDYIAFLQTAWSEW